MMKQRSEIIKALEEVLQDARGKTSLKERYVEVEDVDVYQIRQKYHLTQLEFARTFGFNIRTLQQWEQGRRRTHGSALVLLKVVDYAPDIVHKALHY